MATVQDVTTGTVVHFKFKIGDAVFHRNSGLGGVVECMWVNADGSQHVRMQWPNKNEDIVTHSDHESMFVLQHQPS